MEDGALLLAAGVRPADAPLVAISNGLGHRSTGSLPPARPAPPLQARAPRCSGCGRSALTGPRLAQETKKRSRPQGLTPQFLSVARGRTRAWKPSSGSPSNFGRGSLRTAERTPRPGSAEPRNQPSSRVDCPRSSARLRGELALAPIRGSRRAPPWGQHAWRRGSGWSLGQRANRDLGRVSASSTPCPVSVPFLWSSVASVARSSWCWFTSAPVASTSFLSHAATPAGGFG